MASEPQTDHDILDRPYVFMKPPKLYGLALAAGFLLDLLIPLGLFEFWVQFALGIPLLCVAGWHLHRSLKALTDAGTNIPVDMPTTALVTTGPYAKSRNPVYTGLTALYIAVCVFVDWPWALLFLAPVLYLMNARVVPAEEIYLEGKFGDTYRDYCAKVKRWGTF